jgi:WD40 repeat protein
MLVFTFFTFVSAHSSLAGSQNQKKIVCVMNPELPILASVADDESIRFWDLQKKQMIVSKYIGTQATAVAYSPDGSFLIVGLVNGIMLVLDAKIVKLQYGTYMEEYTMPTLEVVMSQKEAKAGVVCMSFSYRGDYLAVGFNNEYREEEVQTKTGEYASRDPSFVVIYVNRLS